MFRGGKRKNGKWRYNMYMSTAIVVSYSSKPELVFLNFTKEQAIRYLSDIIEDSEDNVKKNYIFHKVDIIKKN